MATLWAHKEDQLPAESNRYGKESPIIMNLVPVQKTYENKMWNLENLWVTDLQENFEFKIYNDVSWILYTCDTGEKKRHVQKGQMRDVKYEYDEHGHYWSMKTSW